MSNEYIKISSGVNFTWEVEDLVKKFVDVDVPGSARVYSDPLNRPHWQMYHHSNIAFARNFSINFPRECEEVVDRLRLVQHSMKSQSINHHLIGEFIQHNINPGKVSLIKTWHEDVEPHCDVTRNISINIGLKNSNKGTTYISDNTNHEQFWEQNLTSYTMEDGDVYLLHTKNAHTVKSNFDPTSESIRYIVTYNMITV
jgi:hypothetical protein